MGKIGDLFKADLQKAFTQPGMSTGTETMQGYSQFVNKLKEEDVSEEWSEKYKKSIDCSHPKGFSQKAHCASVRKKKKSETKEATGSGSAGAFEGPLFGGDSNFGKKSNSETPKIGQLKEACWKGYKKVGMKNKDGKMVPNCISIKEEVEKVEAKEATGSGSVGGYSSPSMLAKSTKKKDWGPSRKTQIPGGGFVKVKKKCTKFPYCNQGDINALKITKSESVQDAIKNVSKKMKISEDRIKKILEQEMMKLNKRTK